MQRESLTVQFPPEVKAGLRTAAHKAERTMTAHLVELIREDCKRRGIKVEEKAGT